MISSLPLLKAVRNYSILCLAALLILSIGACSSDDNVTNPAPTGPATEHHPNDGSTDNGDGTTAVTLANTTFHTDQRDFSSETVVTDPATIVATKTAEYDFASNLSSFRIVGDKVVGVITIGAFENHLVVYDLATESVLSTRAPDTYVAGFDYNGIVLTVDGSEDLNFYLLEHDKIGTHFFQVRAFLGSKFLSKCYLDHDIAYIYNSDEIMQFPLHETGNVTKTMDVPSFSQVSFSSDEAFLYVSISSFSETIIRKLDKTNNTVKHTIIMPGTHVSGLSVDANYIYVADKDAGTVVVFNKHTYKKSGTISLPGVHSIEVVGTDLYAFNTATQKLEKYTVSSGNKVTVALADLQNHVVTYNVGGKTSEIHTYLPNSIVSIETGGQKVTASWSTTANIITYTSSTIQYTINSNNGELEKGATYSRTTSGATTTITVENIALTEHNLQTQLMSMGLDSADANYLAAHHAADARAVLDEADRIFKDFHVADAMFALPTDPDAAPFNDPQMTPWSEENKKIFRKMIGRLVFVINAPKFKAAFNANINLLNSAYQGNPPAIPFPGSYADFRTAANHALHLYDNHYKFFISNSTTGVAWGMVGLKLKVEDGLINTSRESDPHSSAGLVLHELTHTFGYTHDSVTPADFELKPNNIPYYIQILTAYESVDVVGVYCAGDPACATPTPPWGTPTALLTLYFGNK